MPPVAGTRYHTTWHGSPHKFYTFDLRKIGTGEGAQAYGHGLYVAEEQAVADGYSGVGKALHNIGFSTFDGMPVHKLKWLKDNSPEEFAFRVIEDSKNIDKAERVINRLANADKETALSKKFFDANKGRLGWESMRPDLSDATPNLYKVDLPADAVARMLDWDAGLHDNPMAVKIALEKVRLGYVRA